MARIDTLTEAISRQKDSYEVYALARKDVDLLVKDMCFTVGDVDVYFKDGKQGIAVFINNKELTIDDGIKLAHGMLRLLTNIYDEVHDEAPCTAALAPDAPSPEPVERTG